MDWINRGNRATKAGFSEGLLKGGDLCKDLVVLGADITSSVGMNEFRIKFPERFFSLGIAEQNCAGVAAGLALGGKIPVFSTYGVFAALRTTDQLRVSICYNNLHVVIGGAHAGISVGPDGATHQALEDMAVMRVLPNMTLLSPCDATQTAIATIAAIKDCKGPVYIRFGREAVPDFTRPDQEFVIGKGQVFEKGKDITIIATGHMTWEAIQATRILKSRNINATVINLHTIKPFDKELVISSAIDTGAVLTAEEHQVNGGLGGATAEILARNFPVQMDFVGMEDRFGESGQPEELMRKYGLNAENIAQRAELLLQRKLQ